MIEFDPAWEYYVADPEVQWIFDKSGAVSRFDAVVGDRLVDQDNPGLRFGRGDPDRITFSLGPDGRPTTVRIDNLNSQGMGTLQRLRQPAAGPPG